MAASSSSANRKIRLNDEAYIMIGLHACKYPDSPVLGYLIGTEVNDQYDVLDIFPIGHSVPAGPVLEMSAELAERSHSKKGNKILGFYFGLEYGATFAPPYIERITANLKTIIGNQAIVLQFKNDLLSEGKQLYLEGALVSGTSVKIESLAGVGVLSGKFSASIGANRHLLLCDFEQHMNSDSFADFHNTELVNSLKSL